MTRNRVPILQRVARDVRQGTLLDVYKIVEDVSREFPEVPEKTLEKIVSEEVVKTGGNAVWSKKAV